MFYECVPRMPGYRDPWLFSGGVGTIGGEAGEAPPSTSPFISNTDLKECLAWDRRLI